MDALAKCVVTFINVSMDMQRPSKVDGYVQQQQRLNAFRVKPD